MDGKRVIFSNIDGIVGDIIISTVLELKSLVFEPEFYYQGIEALEVATFNYFEQKIKAVDVDKDNHNDAPTQGAAFTMAPDMAATVVVVMIGMMLVAFGLYRLRFRQARLQERMDALKEQLED